MATAPDRAGRYRIIFEDDSVMRLYRQTVEDFALYAGAELSEKQMEQLKVAAGEMSAKMRAVRIVAASSVSKRELERRLVQKGENPQQAKLAVSWMDEMSLLDDLKTAEQIIARCISKGYGKARAKQALYEKQIPKEIWDEVLLEYPDQINKIMDFLESHLSDNPTDKDLRRAIDALLRRGHTYGTIRRAMHEMAMDSNEFPED